MTAAALLHALLGALAGLLLGLAFFRGLAAATRHMVHGDIRRALPLHALRLGGAVLAFTMTAIYAGAAALLGLLAGFQLARTVMVRRVTQERVMRGPAP